MIMMRAFLTLLSLGCASAGTVSGTVRWRRSLGAGEEVAAALVPLATRTDGSPLPLEKLRVQGAFLSYGDVSPAAHDVAATPAEDDGAYAYRFDDVSGAFAVVAFVRRKGAAWIDFSLPQMGFHTGEGECNEHSHTQRPASVTIFERFDRGTERNCHRHAW